MPKLQDYMRSTRRVTQRVAPAFAAVASVFLFATCDFDKISSTPAPIDQATLNRLFSISPTSDSLLTLGGSLTLSVEPGAGVDLSHTLKRWSSSAAAVAFVDSLTGQVTGVSLGTAIIKARVLAPELDTGYSKTHAIRVRFKGIRVASLDSITGLGLFRPVVVNGTDNFDALVSPPISGATLSTHDSGSSANTIAAIVGSATVSARKNGIAYVVGLFDGFKDSTKVKIRQVAKSIIFPQTDYTAHALNANRNLPFTIRDVNDSIMTSSPVMRFGTSDTTVVQIDSLTGAFSMKKLDTARIFVRVDTVTRSQKILMDQVVATLEKVALTDAQSDTVGQLLPLAPSVTVRDSGNTPVVGASVTFRAGNRIGLIVDSVRTTDAEGVATLGSWTLGDTAGTYTVIATSGIASATFTATALPDRPFGLRFSQQPALAGATEAIAPGVKVTIVDSLGNTVTDATNTVTIALANNPGATTLSGILSATAVDGVATFDSLKVGAAGSGYTLEATSAGLTNAISNAFDVFGSATHLLFDVQPSDVTIGTAIRPAIKVAVKDAAGTTVATSTHSVTLAFADNPGGAIMGGTLTQTAVGGIATFSDVTLDAIANGYTLTATATGITSATSVAFNTRAVGAVAKVGIIVEPTNVTAGANITPGIQVELQDATGARVTSASHTIRLSILSNAGGGTLNGTNDISTASGVATFNNLNIDRAGTGYTLLASVVNFSFGTDTTVAFNVNPGIATKLGYLQHPTHVNPTTPMSTSVLVAIQDALGNTVASTPPTNVSVALGGGTVGATLGGTTTQQTLDGVATFTGLTVSTAGTGYFLNATSGTLTNSASGLFNAVAASGGAIRLRFVGTPASSGANATLTSVQVELIDNNGARVTTNGIQIVISVGSGPGTLLGTFTANTSSGVATFSNLRLQTSGSYTLAANSNGFPTAASPTFTVAPGTAQGTAFLTPFPTLVAGATITPAIKVGIVDAFDNVVPSATSNITLSYNFSPFGAAALTGSLTKSTTDGVATFDDIVIGTVGNGYQLFGGNSSGFGSAFSNFFDVVAGTPVGLAFEVQPSSSVTAGDELSPSIKVKIQDAGGNPVASATNSITLALTGGDANATLAGTKTVAPSNGVATFAGMSVDKPGTGYRLSASASGFTTVNSSPFTVNIGFATKLRFSVQPSNISGGGTFSVTTEITDNAGNLITNSDRTIFLNIKAGTGTSGAVIGGTTSQFSSGGIATFNNVSVDKVGTGYKLEATASFGLTAAESNAFDVTQGPAAKLVFTVQPTQTNGGAIITPAIKVSITDNGGNVVTDATNQVSITKTGGSGSAILSGTLTASAVAGVATFSNLSIDKAANFYSLTATAAGLAGGTSNSFNVIVGPKSRLVVTSQPTSVTSMFTFTLQFAVADAGGNTVSGQTDAVTVAIKAGTGTAGAVFGGVKTISASNGTATFSNMTIDKAGSGYQIEATATGLTAGLSNTITVNPGAASQMAFVQQPTNVGYATIMSPAVTVAIQDAQGNTTTSTNFVTLSVGTDPAGSTTLTGGNSVQAVAGIATFPALSLNKVADGYTLSASGSLPSVASTTFNVTSPGFLTTGTAINDMVRVGDTVYFTQGAALKKVHFRGGTVGTVTSSPSGSYGRVVADATNIYWQQVGPTNSNDSFIRKMAVVNGTVTTLTTANTNMRSSSNSLATDGTNVYFLAQNNGATGLAIRSIPVNAASGSPTDIQGAHASDPQFMVSGGLIYFYNHTANSISRMTTSGASLTTLANAQNANLFALSGTTLFIGHGDGIKSIASANSIGGPVSPTIHLSGTANIYNMTLDGTNLYANVNGDLRRYLTSNFATVTSMSLTAAQTPHGILIDAAGALIFNDTSDRIAKVIK